MRTLGNKNFNAVKTHENMIQAGYKSYTQVIADTGASFSVQVLTKSFRTGIASASCQLVLKCAGIDIEYSEEPIPCKAKQMSKPKAKRHFTEEELDEIYEYVTERMRTNKGEDYE